MGEIGEDRLTIDGIVLGISVEQGDFCQIFKIDGEAVILNSLRLVTLVVFRSIGLELLVLLTQRACSEGYTQEHTQQHCHCPHNQ
jgi:hypothetical protein